MTPRSAERLTRGLDAEDNFFDESKIVPQGWHAKPELTMLFTFPSLRG